MLPLLAGDDVPAIIVTVDERVVPGFSRYKRNNGALGTRKNDGVPPVSGAPIDCIGTFHNTANDQFLSGRGNVGYVDGHASTHWAWESELITTPDANSCD